MCGILGIIAAADSATRLTDGEVIAMRDTMAARGPDGAGLFRRGPVTLAHRRLAIRDIANGAQPLVSQNGRFAVVFNGEIYNDHEIRNELQPHGIALQTACDTEVLVEAWALWGIACIEKLRGMFAFGMIDLRTGELWLVRDRCGIKPLFYADVGGDFVFASSIAAIKRHPRFAARPNFTAISHYLRTLRTTLDYQTVFEGIHTLRPAELIHVVGNRRTHRFYWSLPEAIDHSIPFDEAVWQMERTLEESVRLRLKSDVPVGMMMSGGVDSNTLATMVRQQVSHPVTGCCGGGRDPAISEVGGDFDFSGQCAKELGFNYCQVGLGEREYLETWQDLIGSYETPVATPTDAIIFHVARQLKQSVGVAIGGEGADEAFCGYTIPHWCGNDLERANTLVQRNDSFAKMARASLIRQYGRDRFSSASEHYLSTCGLISGSAQTAMFAPDYLPAADSKLAAGHYYEQLFDLDSHMSMSEKYARVLFKVNLESLLSRLDSATMAAGLEARVPFADHRLVEQAFRLPHHFKIDICPNETQPWLSSQELAQRGSLRSKRILRAVASRMMPKQLACRPKMSFPTPLSHWLDQTWRPWVSEKLLNSPFAKEVFQRPALEKLAQLPSSMALWHWPILNTILWGDRCFA